MTCLTTRQSLKHLRMMAMSLFDITEETPIHETQDFGVYVGQMRPVHKDEQTYMGYLLVNKRTGVIEAQGTLEYNAITAMRQLQTELEAALDGKAASEVGDVTFEDVMARLAERGGAPEPE